MKAAVWHGRGDVRVEEVPEPPSPPWGQVKVEVAWCGICGTDLHEYLGGPLYVPVDAPHPLTGAQAPVILGPELSGRVVDGGPDVTRVGDTVLVAGRYHAQTHLLKLHPETMTLDTLMDLPMHNLEAFACGSLSETLADTEIASAAKHVWPQGDRGYPEFLVLDDRRVLMAYYDGQAFEHGVPKQADIRLATFTVDH